MYQCYVSITVLCIPLLNITILCISVTLLHQHSARISYKGAQQAPKNEKKGPPRMKKRAPKNEKKGPQAHALPLMKKAAIQSYRVKYRQTECVCIHMQ